MKNESRKKRFAMGMAIFLFIFSLGTQVFAEKSGEKVLNQLNSNLKNFTQELKENTIINGVLGEYNFFFKVGKNWNLHDYINMELMFSHANAKNYYGSSLTVFVNGVPVKSILLNEENNQGQLNLKISKKHIQTGFNRVRIKTYHRLSERICEDNLNPANWVVIHSGSRLSGIYELKKDSKKLYDYPYPYVDASSKIPGNFSFVVENNPSEVVLGAVMTLSAQLGNKVKDKKIDMKVIHPQDMKLSKKHFIYVGAEIPSDLAAMLPVSFEKKADQGCLFETQVYGKRCLFILAPSQNLLQKAVNLLGNSDVVEQMDSEIVTVGPNTPLSSSYWNFEGKISFEDMGYGDVQSESSKMIVSQYYFDVPNNLTAKENARLHLYMRHSDVVNREKSSVTLHIDNKPVESKKLSFVNPKGDEVIFEIPRKMLLKDGVQIKLIYHLNKEEDCADASRNPGYWIFTSKKSYIEFPFEEKEDYTLNDYPAPFVNGGWLTNTNFAFRKNATTEQLELATNISAYFGRRSNKVDRVSASYEKIKDEANNLCIGLLDKDGKFLNVGPLNIDFKKGESIVVKSEEEQEEVILLPQYRAKVSSVQILPPTLKKTANLIVTGTDEKTLLWSRERLTKKGFSYNLPVDTLFIDKRGYEQYVRVHSENNLDRDLFVGEYGNKENKNKFLESENKKKKRKEVLIFLGFLGIIFLVFLIGLIATIRKKPKI